MAMVLGNVEHEKYLFMLSFTKNKLKNRHKTHLDLVVCMYTQKNYTLENFPFPTMIKSWTTKKVCRTTK
jgi:hypothetical protein